MIRTAALLGSMLLISSAVAQEPSAIAGQVMDSATGKPLAQVDVRLTARQSDGSRTVIYGALSDSEGHFSIAPIPAGSYQLEPRRRGYFFVPSAKNGPPSFTVNIKADEPLRDFRIEMTPAAILSGRVLDESGEPAGMRQARVLLDVTSPKDYVLLFSIDGAGLWRGAMLNGRGEYRISVPPGKYFLSTGASPSDEIRSDGTLETVPYARTFYPSTAEGRAAAAVEAHAGEETAGLDIRLVRNRTYSIRGTVAGAGPNAPVVVHIVGPDTFIDASAKDGAFFATHLVPGRYTINAEGGEGNAKLRSPTLELEIHEDTANIALMLTVPIRLSGTVSGAPGAGVRLGPPREIDDSFAFSAPVSADGAFEFARVQPDRYRLTVKPVPEDSYIKSVELNGGAVTERTTATVYPRNAAAPSQAVPLDLSAVAGDAKLKIVIAKGARLSGTVERGTEKVTDGLGFVQLFHEHAKPGSEGELWADVETDGSYVVRGIPPGRYHVLATHTLEQSGDDSAFPKMVADSEVIEFHEGERVTKDLKVASADARKNK
jgi:5-hydroxyisourate hydrolase-like protein (transthyretin family)